MAEHLSYDIYILGLKDPSSRGRHRFASTIENLTGRAASDFDDHFPSSMLPMFEALYADRARTIVDALSDAGIIIEVRPTDTPPVMEVFEEQASTRICPACDQMQLAAAEECAKCGVVFAKFEREQLVKMHKDHTLEEAMVRTMQIREEWLHRATEYLKTNNLPKEASAEFATVLLQDEVPFLRLDSDEGPVLLTSRRIIENRDGKFQSVPYEMISDVDYGGGKLTATRKSKKRLQITFHTPIPVGGDEKIKNLAWHLDKESSFRKDVVIDWGFARSFICGTCGERDLQYRTDGNKVHMRCMHCATDHEIDLAEGVAVPILAE